MAITQKQIDKFWSRMRQSGDCLLWTLGKDEKGFGNIRFDGKHTRAHRVAFEISTGKKVKSGMTVKHSCENRLCCNPKHLYLSKNGNDSATWEASFWRRVKIGGKKECWQWIGKSRTGGGYGTFRDRWTPENGRGRMLGAHVIAYRIARGDTKNLQVLHECDNPICCNPSHLFLGTQKDNIQDMIKKGRGRLQKLVAGV